MNKESFLYTVNTWRSMSLSGNRPDLEEIIPCWHTTRNIEIVAQSGISAATIDMVKKSIEARLYQIFFDNSLFRMNVSTKNIDDYIKYFVDSKNEIDDKKFARSTYKSLIQQNRPRAAVFLTRSFFLNDHASWGRAAFEDGCMILALPENRQNNLKFLSDVVGHEMGHLLGFPDHCDTFGEVDGYKYSPKCNMHYSVPSGCLCEKCKDFIRTWWQGLP